jgi:hypothetical protein
MDNKGHRLARVPPRLLPDRILQLLDAFVTRDAVATQERIPQESGFRLSGHASSISLEPFAPPALPGFVATMVPLTPVGRLFVSTLRLIVDGSTAVSDNEHRL